MFKSCVKSVNNARKTCEVLFTNLFKLNYRSKNRLKHSDITHFHRSFTTYFSTYKNHILHLLNYVFTPNPQSLLLLERIKNYERNK